MDDLKEPIVVGFVVGAVIGYMASRIGWFGKTYVHLKSTDQHAQLFSTWLFPLNAVQWDEIKYDDADRLETRTTTVFSMRPIELVYEKKV
jgi:hypothetical protein